MMHTITDMENKAVTLKQKIKELQAIVRRTNELETLMKTHMYDLYIQEAHSMGNMVSVTLGKIEFLRRELHVTNKKIRLMKELDSLYTDKEVVQE